MPRKACIADSMEKVQRIVPTHETDTAHGDTSSALPFNILAHSLVKRLKICPFPFRATSSQTHYTQATATELKARIMYVCSSAAYFANTAKTCGEVSLQKY